MGASDTLPSVEAAETNAYDVAVECVGLQTILQACQPALRLLKELSIRFSVCYTPDEFREVIAAFGSGTVDPTPVVGPTLGLSRIAEAFDLTRGARVHGRVLVRPE